MYNLHTVLHCIHSALRYIYCITLYTLYHTPYIHCITLYCIHFFTLYILYHIAYTVSHIHCSTLYTPRIMLYTLYHIMYTVSHYIHCITLYSLYITWIILYTLRLCCTHVYFCTSYLQAVDLHLHPLYLMLPVTVSASYAFMLPVATGPNALAFSSGYLKMSDMVSCS